MQKMRNGFLGLVLFTTVLACKDPSVATSQTGPPLMSGSRTLVWSDEFDKPGLPDADKWKYDVGGDGWGNKELQYYTSQRTQNARVEDGKLIIEARKEEYQGQLYYTSARLSTQGKTTWTYGRMEILAKMPAGRGTWVSLWMLGKDYTSYSSWPKCGEIDIMEHVGFNEGMVHGSLHSQAFNHLKNNQKTKAIPIKGVTTDYHVYAIEWTEDQVDFFVDDLKYYTVKKSEIGTTEAQWPFDKPFFLILNVAIGGNWGGQKGIDDSIWPQRLEIDYVRVFQ